MKEINDKLSLQKVLQQEKNLGYIQEFFISTNNGQVFVPAIVKKVDLVNNECWLTAVTEDGEELEELIKRGQECKLRLVNSGWSTFSYFQSLSVDSKLIKISFPEVGYQIERRDSERLSTFHSQRVRIPIGVDKVKRSFMTLDISEGGFSFIMSQMETFNVKEGEILEGVTLDGVPFHFTVKIASTLRVPRFVYENIPYAGKKVSCQFLFKEESHRQKWLDFWPKLRERLI